MFDRSRRRLLTQRPQPDAQRMPWVVADELFTDQCTRCNKCIDACETHIIAKSDGGFPAVDFHRGECTFCYRCAQACPESLFNPQSDQPWLLQAQANEKCLAQQKIECRSCSDACEGQAIQFTLQVGGVAKPNINPEACTGCGACVSLCPISAISIVAAPNQENL
ncbi:ferredoxin-type protein NapF [Photobacterium nomapromontoriensis]|uniref:ferredoxin-type protein NapF n=1 Tax=Photobacterium nomapromontoriensis TaxID=2910237 RepID=UPI003D0F33FF